MSNNKIGSCECWECKYITNQDYNEKTGDCKFFDTRVGFTESCAEFKSAY